MGVRSAMISVLAGLKLVGGTSPYLGASCHLIFATGVPTLSSPPARCRIQDLKPLKQEDLFRPSPSAPALRPARPGALRPSRGRSRVPFFPAGVPVRQIVPDRPVEALGVPAAQSCIAREKRGKPRAGARGRSCSGEVFRGNPLSRGGVGIRGMRSRDLKSRQDETRLVGPPLCVFSDLGDICKACARFSASGARSGEPPTASKLAH